MDDEDGSYSRNRFHYIHQNPLHARMVKRMEDWEFSSFREYLGTSQISIYDKEQAFDLLKLSRGKFYEESYQFVNNRPTF